MLNEPVARLNMELSARKEQFSLAYIKAIAAQAGLNTSSPAVDDESIDLTLSGRNYPGTYRRPQMDVQVKCTSQQFVKGNELRFPLKIKNFRDLTATNVVIPRFLMVLIVPEHVEGWVCHSFSNCITLFGNCYWVKLAPDPQLEKNATSVTVRVSLDQKLTSVTLHRIMTLISQGELTC